MEYGRARGHTRLLTESLETDAQDFERLVHLSQLGDDLPDQGVDFVQRLQPGAPTGLIGTGQSHEKLLALLRARLAAPETLLQRGEVIGELLHDPEALFEDVHQLLAERRHVAPGEQG